jgi:hypothetical protein
MPVLTVWQVCADFAARPRHYFIRQWHWKGALFSSAIRCLIFLAVNLPSGWKAAQGAALAEFCYRIVASGFYASMTQAFRKAQPAWAAYLTAMLLLPVFQHAIEFLVHWMRGTPRLWESLGASAAFTVLSTSYNLYSMRRGTMVVGPEGKSLWRDIRDFPGVFVGFVTEGPRLLWGRRFT